MQIELYNQNYRLDYTHALLGYDRSPVLVNDRTWDSMERFRNHLHERITMLPLRHRYELSLKTRNPHERMSRDQAEHTALIQLLIQQGERGMDYRGYSLESLRKVTDGIVINQEIKEIPF